MYQLGMGLLIVDTLNRLIINTQTLILTLDTLVVDVLISLILTVPRLSA